MTILVDSASGLLGVVSRILDGRYLATMHSKAPRQVYILNSVWTALNHVMLSEQRHRVT